MGRNSFISLSGLSTIFNRMIGYGHAHYIFRSLNGAKLAMITDVRFSVLTAIDYNVVQTPAHVIAIFVGKYASHAHAQ